MKKIIILGSGGMIGNSILKFLSSKNKYSIFGTTRSSKYSKKLTEKNKYRLFNNLDLEKKKNNLEKIFDEVNPDVVINCVGIVHHSKEIQNIHKVILLNSLLPHTLEKLCKKKKARFINISTDCVFSGIKGNYNENDLPDAPHLYGRSKFLGEVHYGNSVTLRTSLIGHEQKNKYGLLEWFLRQNGNIDGYKKAIFSGLTVIEFARIISDYVIPNNKLKGLYHVSSEPISKYDLLLLIKNIYDKNIDVKPENKKVVIDRSLDSFSFRKITGYLPKQWHLMIQEMKNF